MSHDSSLPPYRPLPAGEAKPSGEPRMQYMVAYQYIFENPNWVMNVLLAALCFLIPVVGPIVLLGYQFIIIESLLQRRAATYPDFDFNQFGPMLTRGIWPFLVALIAQLVITPVMMVSYFGGFMCFGVLGAALSDENEAAGGICMLVGFLVLFAALMLLSVLFGLVLMPMTLAAGLSQELGPAFNFAFIKDFIARLWKEMILVSLFIMASGMILAPLGMLVLCIGLYAAMALLMLANAHLLYQLYQLYLFRGGMAMALKEGK